MRSSFTVELDRGAAERRLEESNLTLFFSLPFKPARSVNLFLNGHIALGLEERLYQVYDPKLLKADFLFSVMPEHEWLFGEAGPWVERDPSSPRYRHVHLYRVCESRRTVIYHAGLQVAPWQVRQIEARLAAAEERFKRGELAFQLLRTNCASIVAEALCGAGLVTESPLNRLPLLLFKRFVERVAGVRDVRLGKVAMMERSAFELHRYCVGAGLRQPERAIDRWLSGLAARSTRMGMAEAG